LCVEAQGAERKGGCGNVKKPRMLSFTSGPPMPKHVHTKFPTLKPKSLYRTTNRARAPPLSEHKSVRGGPRCREERGVRECQGGRSPACYLSPPDLLTRSMFPSLNLKSLYQPRTRPPAVRAHACAWRPKGPKGKGGAGMSRRKKPRMLSFTSGPPTPKHAHTKFPTLKP
jgi:hypothetical protein